MKPELKPCPICNSKVECKFVPEKDFGEWDHYSICCEKGNDHITQVIRNTEAEAISAWNRRAQPGGEPVKCALPERDESKPAEQQGLFRKFDVRRTDGSDHPGGKHHGCRYFVLDIDHDPYAQAALSAYAGVCERSHPELAADLRDKWGAVEPSKTEYKEAAERCRDMGADKFADCFEKAAQPADPVKVTLSEAKRLLGLPEVPSRLSLGDGLTIMGSSAAINAVKAMSEPVKGEPSDDWEGKILAEMDRRFALRGEDNGFERLRTDDTQIGVEFAIEQFRPILNGDQGVQPYKDSTPELRVGNSSFEHWFQSQSFACQVGIKQISRDSYAAGMGGPLVTAAQPVTNNKLSEVIAFLHGEGPLRGVHFGDRHPDEKGAYWWRKDLRAAIQAQPAAQQSLNNNHMPDGAEHAEYTLAGLIHKIEVAANPNQGAVPWYMCDLLRQALPFLKSAQPASSTETTSELAEALKHWYAQSDGITVCIPVELVQEMYSALAAPVAAQPSVSEGYALVPIEPTNEMLEAGAGSKYEKRARNVWRDMLKAAPKP